MLAKIQIDLQVRCELCHDQPVLVGVSGGPDSLCLMDVLVRLGYPLVIAHLDHLLRPEAGEDALVVKAIAAQRGLPFVSAEEDVAALAERESLSVEEAARKARYRFLFEQARRWSAQAVVVGHTADDQVETVLMHLLRGSGLSGLRGMSFRSLPNPWSAEVPLVRPLLGIWRAEILSYCEERGLHPLLDRTNLDTTFFRNRLRHDLIPYLKSYNPSVRQVLWRTAQVLAGDEEVLAGVVASAREVCVQSSRSGWVAFDLAALAAQPLGVQRRLFRWAIAELRPGLRDISFDCVERAVQFLAQPSHFGQCNLVAGLWLSGEADRLWLTDRAAELPADDWPQVGGNPLDLPVPGEVNLPPDWLLRAEIIPDVAAGMAQARENDDPFRAWVNLDGLLTPLVVRARLPGDRLQPLGMEGSQKLSELMINLKLPRRGRAGWPLVCARRESSGDEEIVWVAGFRLAHPFRLTADTQRAALIHLSKSPTVL